MTKVEITHAGPESAGATEQPAQRAYHCWSVLIASA